MAPISGPSRFELGRRPPSISPSATSSAATHLVRHATGRHPGHFRLIVPDGSTGPRNGPLPRRPRIAGRRGGGADSERRGFIGRYPALGRGQDPSRSPPANASECSAGRCPIPSPGSPDARQAPVRAASVSARRAGDPRVDPRHDPSVLRPRCRLRTADRYPYLSSHGGVTIASGWSRSEADRRYSRPPEHRHVGDLCEVDIAHLATVAMPWPGTKGVRR